MQQFVDHLDVGFIRRRRHHRVYQAGRSTSTCAQRLGLANGATYRYNERGERVGKDAGIFIYDEAGHTLTDHQWVVTG